MLVGELRACASSACAPASNCWKSADPACKTKGSAIADHSEKRPPTVLGMCNICLASKPRACARSGRAVIAMALRNSGRLRARSNERIAAKLACVSKVLKDLLATPQRVRSRLSLGSSCANSCGSTLARKCTRMGEDDGAMASHNRRGPR